MESYSLKYLKLYQNASFRIEDLYRQLTHQMIWLPKNRPPETPWLLQSSGAVVGWRGRKKSSEARSTGESVQCKSTMLNGAAEGSLKGIGTPWLSQYTDQLFQWLSVFSTQQRLR